MRLYLADLSHCRFSRGGYLAVAISCALLPEQLVAQRYSPTTLCTISNNSVYESITLPIDIYGDYPSGSVVSTTTVVGDTEIPTGGEAAVDDLENVIISIDANNDGILEALGNASCLYNPNATPAGCSVTQSFTIPTVTEDTSFRGRVTLSYNDLAPANGCGANGFGDSEDFIIVANVLETITIADASGPEDGGPITLTATLSHNVRDAGGFVSFTVDYLASDGTATITDNDYGASSGTLTFNGQAGDSQTFTIAPTPDGVPEGDQTVSVSLLNLSNITHGIDISGQATLTIIEDDDEVELSLVKSVSDTAPNINDTVVFTLEVNNAGPSAAFDAVVQDTVPAGFSSILPLSFPSGSSFSVVGNSISWTGIDVPVNGGVSATYSAVVQAP